MDAKYLKMCIKFVLFYSLSHKHDVYQELSQNNLQKKLNHKASGSTEMTHKYLAYQFFLREQSSRVVVVCQQILSYGQLDLTATRKSEMERDTYL